MLGLKCDLSNTKSVAHHGATSFATVLFGWTVVHIDVIRIPAHVSCGDHPQKSISLHDKETSKVVKKVIANAPDRPFIALCENIPVENGFLRLCQAKFPPALLFWGTITICRLLVYVVWCRLSACVCDV